MITLKKISLYEIPEAIEISYRGDQELFDKYHVAKFDLRGCVQSTLMMIRDAGKVQKMVYHKVIYQKQCIGYLVTFDNFLYSFGINIKFRKKDILIEWCERVKQLLGDEFGCALYENNTRAIDFLIRNGMEIGTVENNIVILINSKVECLS